MRNLIVILCMMSIRVNASNWEKFNAEKGTKCMPSYFYNMKPIKRVDETHLQVSQNSIGLSSSGIVELERSGDFPSFGDFVDIGVERLTSKNGMDYWKECHFKTNK